MAITFEGKDIATSASGYLENLEDWNKGLAEHIAGEEGIALADRHWDLINYLREEYTNNAQNQPNTRAMVKAMSAAWGEKISQKNLFELFPGNPSKQAGRIAGLPESRRKGGY